MFRTWPNYLCSKVEMYCIRLPGRESRLQEPAFTRMDALIEALIPHLLPNLDKPFTFFGHSMGALVSFEIARLLRQNYNLHPLHLFISARRSPQSVDPNGQRLLTYTLPDSEFIASIQRFNGLPQLLLEDQELMNLFLPTLRADFAVLETYEYVPEHPLKCGIDVFGGLQDLVVTRSQLDGWKEQTSEGFCLQMFEGDHFFLNSNKVNLLHYMSQTLEKY